MEDKEGAQQLSVCVSLMCVCVCVCVWMGKRWDGRTDSMMEQFDWKCFFL